jgi:hypothetical protein
MTKFWKPGSLPPAPASSVSTPGNSISKAKVLNVNEKADSNREKVGVQLSSAVMSMKFMKRKDESELHRAAEREKLSQIKDNKYLTNEDFEDNTNDNIAGGKNNFKVSYCAADASLYLPGRRSFGGFNKAVEKHYQSVVLDDLNTSRRKNDGVTITDEEMLHRYEKLIGLPRGPNQGQASKRSNPTTKADKPNSGPSSRKIARRDDGN